MGEVVSATPAMFTLSHGLDSAGPLIGHAGFHEMIA
jgi:hypothetical protein